MLEAIADLKARWARGEMTTNCWLGVPQSFVTEIAGMAGFDSLCVDLQHGLVELGDLPGMLQAAAAAGKPGLVRVAWNSPSVIMRALDIGAALGVVAGRAREQHQAAAVGTHGPRDRFGHGEWCRREAQPGVALRGHEQLEGVHRRSSYAGGGARGRSFRGFDLHGRARRHASVETAHGEPDHGARWVVPTGRTV